MSPAIAKTSEPEILAAARRLIQRDGAEELALRDVADAVGIKAPSLYKRYADRTALLTAVKVVVLAELEATIRQAISDHPPKVALGAMASAYRDFAKSEPELYRLIYRHELKMPGLVPERSALAPVLQLLEAIVGQDSSLSAARCMTAFLHGFASMEIDGNFQLGGSIDQAFDYAVDAILLGLEARSNV